MSSGAKKNHLKENSGMAVTVRAKKMKMFVEDSELKNRR